MPIPSFFCSLLLCRRGRAPPLLLLVFLLVVSTPRLPSNALFCSGSSKISFFLSAVASATGHRFTGLYLEWSVSCSAGISWGLHPSSGTFPCCPHVTNSSYIFSFPVHGNPRASKKWYAFLASKTPHWKVKGKTVLASDGVKQYKEHSTWPT